MTPSADFSGLERFRTAIAACLGLHFDDTKLTLLDEVLQRRLNATRLSPTRYFSRLRQNDPAEVGELARELTVGETYFFRHAEQLRVFGDVVLASRTGGRRVRVLSAGCASGEEAYSLAMVARERGRDVPAEVSILGVDVNPAAIQKARRGRFSTWALRGMPEDVKQRWLRHDGRDFVIDESLKDVVQFEEANLADEQSAIWHRESYDAIFCRNVLMYFDPDHAQTIVGRFCRALREGGYLFLGHAENLRGVSTDFDLCHTHETFYYQRKERISDAAPQEAIERGSPLPAFDQTDTWVEVIRSTAEHIETLVAPPPRPAAAASTAAAAASAWDLGLALELVRKERFTEALAIVESLPPESSRDPDVLLLHAVLLTHGGAFDQAEQACRRLLEVDGLSAGAHYLLALCREGRGDRPAALHHDQVAIYLDPGFAMPRLHLGLLARRSGDRPAARRDLGQALFLLQREDASRILLFGGGFGRDMLVALCRAELLRSGDSA